MKKIFCLLVASWLSLVPVIFAQETGTESAMPVTETMTWSQIIDAGGSLMYVLAAMSIVGVTLVIYFVMVLRREQIVPSGLQDELQSLLRKGDFAGAEKVCLAKPCALASIALAAVRHKLRVGATDIGLLRETMEGEGGRQSTLIQNQIQYLLDIAIIAPMIGLLGTVLGMLRAFNSVALDTARARPLELAEGVSQALITTVAGLIVAIPAMMAYAYFRGRTTKLISDLEAASADLASEMQEHAPR